MFPGNLTKVRDYVVLGPSQRDPYYNEGMWLISISRKEHLSEICDVMHSGNSIERPFNLGGYHFQGWGAMARMRVRGI